MSDAGGSRFTLKGLLAFLVLFAVVFQNYYSPGSPFLTLALNLGLLAGAFALNTRLKVRYDAVVVILTGGILLWSMLVMGARLDADTQVVMKYWRVAISTLALIGVCSALNFTAERLLTVLAGVFLAHVLAIWVQVQFPQIEVPMAKLFGFEREASIITNYSTRKLGCSTSYDTASMISIASMIFFYTRYATRRKLLDLLFLGVSFFASLRSSRLGMALGLAVFAVIFIRMLVQAKGHARWILALTGGVGLVLAYFLVVPLLAEAVGIALLEEGYQNAIASSSDYSSTGTLDVLTSTQLNAFKESPIDLLMGFGVDPNSVPGKSTDIGYAKLVYHLGIIGSTLILFLYGYVFWRILAIWRLSPSGSASRALSAFLMAFIVLALVFNYKSLEIYSRGTHEMFLIVYFVLINSFTASRPDSRGVVGTSPAATG